jgi:hypothetical protein
MLTQLYAWPNETWVADSQDAVCVFINERCELSNQLLAHRGA